MAEEKRATNLKKIEKIVSMMVSNDIVEAEIITGEDKIYLRRPEPQVTQIATAAAPIPVAAPVTAAPAGQIQQPQQVPAADDNLVDIKSPIVGTFYAAPSPDSKPFVKVGDKVEADTVVCIVEAMKVMNEIKAETAGTIAEIVVKNGQAIEYEQVLFKIKP